MNYNSAKSHKDTSIFRKMRHLFYIIVCLSGTKTAWPMSRCHGRGLALPWFTSYLSRTSPYRTGSALRWCRELVFIFDINFFVPNINSDRSDLNKSLSIVDLPVVFIRKKGWEAHCSRVRIEKRCYDISNILAFFLYLQIDSKKWLFWPNVKIWRGRKIQFAICLKN